MSVLMASFITLSPAAREQYRALEQLNGVLLDEAEELKLAADAGSLMARLMSRKTSRKPVPRKPRFTRRFA